MYDRWFTIALLALDLGKVQKKEDQKYAKRG